MRKLTFGERNGVRILVLFAWVAVLFPRPASGAADWPMWRCDAGRTGSMEEELAATLYVQWVRTLPPLGPAWPQWRQVQFDAVYRPVVAGGKMFVGSSHNDALIALDAKTGEELWRFYADGPIRLAPVACEAKVYFVSDDGYLYCVGAAEGKLIWKFFAGPSKRRCIGNGRLISTWPIRGGPVLADGRIYFAAGIWPFEGVFIYALDAKTGEIVWINDSTGYREAAPQGPLVVTGNHLLAPCGRAKPVCLDRGTGKLTGFPGGSHHHSWFGGGGCHVTAVGDYFICGSGLCRIPDGVGIMSASTSWVVSGRIFYRISKEKGILEAFDLSKPDTKTVKDKRGKETKKTYFSRLRQIALPRDLERSVIHMKAGSRIYGSKGRTVFAVDSGKPSDGAGGSIVWKTDVDGTVADMLAANGRLTVVTREGGIYCFGPDKTDPKIYPLPENAPRPPADRWTGTAAGILKTTKAREGYCVVLGVGTGRLVEELARQSSLPVVAVDQDEEVVAALRRKLDAANLYGKQCSVFVGDPLSFRFSPYMAGVVASEAPEAASISKGTAFVKAVFAILRPYGGTVCLQLAPAQYNAFAKAAASAEVANASVKRAGDYSLLIREGPLPGSDMWTHEDANAGNTRMSGDTLVKAPFGTLWFGGEADTIRYFDRHSTGPRPHTAGGRVIATGPGEMYAIDVYTGRVLWKTRIAGFGASSFWKGSHGPRVGRYVSLADAIYVPWTQSCLRLDSATGKKVGEFSVPPRAGEAEPPAWRYVAVWKDILVGGVNPPIFSWKSDLFTAEQLQFGSRSERLISGLVKALQSVKDGPPVKKASDETDVGFVVRNLNTLLDRENLDETFRVKVYYALADAVGKSRTKESMSRLMKELKEHRGQKDNMPAPEYKAGLRRLNRQFLEVHFNFQGKWLVPGDRANWTHSTSKRLVGLDRHTGSLLWTREAACTFPHNSIALGGERVFCLDLPDERQVKALQKEGKSPGAAARLLALDIRTGKTVWEAKKNFLGWIAYSETEDILMISHGSPDGVLSKGRSAWTITYRGKDGKQLWSKQLKGFYAQTRAHPLLVGRMALRQKGSGYDLRTGEPTTYLNPIVRSQTPWGYGPFHRSCADYVGGPNLVVFRLGPAGYYDLKHHTGVGYLSGFRGACHTNMIIADGVLAVPNVAQACSCPYPVHASIGLVYTPENEQWTHFGGEIRPLRRIGLNFGAPGSFLAEDGILWLGIPHLNKRISTPEIKITLKSGRTFSPRPIAVGESSITRPIPAGASEPKWFCRHTSRMKGTGLKQVGASGIDGIQAVEVIVNGRQPAIYAIRLFFAEPERLEVGQRVFNVGIQGKNVLGNLDIVKEAGGPDRTIVRDFKGITIEKALNLTLERSGGREDLEPILCGIEIRKESEEKK